MTDPRTPREKPTLLRELMKITGFVILMFLGLAVLVAGIMGIITYFGYEANEPLWHLIGGIIVVIAFSVFWIYMRTHAWSD